jgi:alpha-tubulin suppressor-like RCC1 family protein
MTDGTLYAWGYNGAGQLGVGDTTTRYLPTRVGTLTNVVQVMTSAKGNRNGEGSADTVCALTGSGQLYCWGYNGYGEVGNYTTAQQNSPVQVATTTDPIAQIEMGGNTWGHTCAITTTGKLYCWGRNGNGQVGNYTTNTQTFPTQVATSTGTVVQVQIGSQSDNGHTCSLNSLGAVTCWGSNDVGQLGLGDTTQRTGVVATSTGLASGVAKIALANYTDSYAITNAGTAYGWGYNNQGELGLGNTTQQNSPQLIPGLSGVTALVPGSGYNASSQYAYACAISSTSSTEVYCWGYNGSGQLGVGDTTQRTSPTLVVGATNATALAIGGVPTANQTCVIIADGTSKCWGYNNYGQLGVGDTVTARSPVNVKIAASNNTGYWNKNGNYLNYMLGNVGIGTTTPYGRLAVTGAGMGGNATFLTANSANITTFMVLDNGSVGIGTTSPGYKLSVGGDQLTSGAMIVNGNIVGGGSLIAGSTTLSSLNLTSDLSVANGGTGLSFFAPGAIIFGNGASPLATSSNLFWDSANNRLGIGTTSPLYNLDVFGTGRFTSSLTLSGVTSCVGGQALQTDASGNIACGTPVTGGISSAGGWSTNNSGRVALATSTDTVAVGATTTPYAKLSVVSGSTATTTLALVPVTAQTANVLDIYNSSGGLAAVVTAGGYLGLGTSTPGSILSIQGVGNFTTATSSFYGSGGINITSGCFAINGTCFAGGGGVWTQANASTTYTLFTRVGIGTTSPWAKFAIQANVGEAPQTLFAIASSSPSATSTLFSIDSSGLTTIGDPSGAGDANFQFAADVNAWSVGYYSGDKSFRIASSTNLATNVAFSISKSGGVGIGTNGPSIWPLYVATATSTSFTSVFTNTANTTTAHGLYVQAGSNSSSGAYMIQFARADGTTIGSITQNAASTVAYNTSSDRRVKENIATTTLGLSDLMRISVRDFDFISDPSHAKTTGFIAQELYGIYPYAVSTNGDNGTTTLSASSTPWSVDYGRVTPLIVKAVQDLNLKVDARGALQATATTTIAALLDSAQATSTAPWLGVFASASQTLKDAMSGFGGLFVQVFKDGIYATAGVFDKVFAQTITATVVNADVVNTKTLCLDDICVTKTQLKDLLDSQHVTPVVPPQNGGTGTTTPPGGTGTSTPPTGTSTPPINGDPSAPIVSVTGENPMMLQVGASYNDPGATVVDDQDENLSYLVSLDGGANMTQAELTLDTSAAGTHTITYTATDTQGNVGQAQRTIIVEAPVVIPPPDQGTGTTTDDGSGGDTASSTPQQ